MNKICSRCKCLKPVSEFDGFKNCNYCREKSRGWKKNNHEKVREYFRKWIENNRAEVNEKRGKYRENNIEKVKGWVRKANSKAILELKDYYIKTLIGTDSTPELIEAKRIQIKIHRLIKEIK